MSEESPYRSTSTVTPEHPLIPLVLSELEVADNKRKTAAEIKKQKEEEKSAKETARLTKIVLKAIALLPENVKNSWDEDAVTLYYKPFGFFYKKRLKLPDNSYNDLYEIARQELQKLGYTAYRFAVRKNDSYSVKHYLIGVDFRPAKTEVS